VRDTFTGGLVGALGGAVCGVLFGALCWATFGQASLVWASGAMFLRACATAGVVASFSTSLIDPEPHGWRELLPRRPTRPAQFDRPQGPYAYLPGTDLVLRTTGQAMRISAAESAGSANGVVNTAPPETRSR
jgi:hypothetical protein